MNSDEMKRALAAAIMHLENVLLHEHTSRDVFVDPQYSHVSNPMSHIERARSHLESLKASLKDRDGADNG